MLRTVTILVLKQVRKQWSMKPEEEHVSSAELSPEERRDLRIVLKDKAYSRRFWATARLWTSWLAGSIIFCLTFWDKIKDYVPTNYLPWGR